jgi:hypothetical protein
MTAGRAPVRCHQLLILEVIHSWTLAIFTAGGFLTLNMAFPDQHNQPEVAWVGWGTVIATGGLWVWSIVDAGRAARRTNAKLARRTHSSSGRLTAANVPPLGWASRSVRGERLR